MSPSTIVAEALDTYGRPTWVAHVPTRIRQQVSADKLRDMLAARPLELTTEQRYARVIAWCRNHVFDEVTATTIAEVGDISIDTARRFMADRPDVFRRVNRTTFEVRDPDADREADRRR